LGATGRTGRHAVAFALAKGYQVTVLVRDPAKMIGKSPNLTVLKGLPTDIADVRMAMKDCDAVISLLSALPEKQSFSFRKVIPPHTLEKSIANALQAMQEQGIQRIISLSSIGAGDSYRYAPWYMRLMIKITNFKIVFADHGAQERLLQESGLNWTIVRPVALNENETMGTLVVNTAKTPSPFRMSRKQLAHFIIDNIDSETYHRKTPILSEI